MATSRMAAIGGTRDAFRAGTIAEMQRHDRADDERR